MIAKRFAPAVLTDLLLSEEEGDPRVHEAIERLEAIRLAAVAEREAATGLAKAKFRSRRVDPLRHAKVVLVDGPRGSGKTTILLRTIARLTAFSDASERGTRPLYFLGLTDLETLSPDLPLAVHVLLRIRSLFLEEARSVSRDVPELPLASTQDLESDWENAMRATTRGRRSNLVAMQARLEATDYHWAVEVAARHNMELAPTFAKLMDNVVESYHREFSPGVEENERSEPLFIVCIDDADMHPEMSAELIQLLRTFWHRNLAFMLAGDTEMFIDGLTSHYEQRLLETADRRARARLLALEAFDKSVPGSQRLTIPETPKHDRWSAFETAVSKAGLGISGDLRSLVLADENLKEALPPHYRERNEMVRAIIDSALGEKNHLIGVRNLGAATWYGASNRSEHPSHISVPARTDDRETRAPSGVSANVRWIDGDFVAVDPLSIRVAIEHDGQQKQWPHEVQSRAGAAFRIWWVGQNWYRSIARIKSEIRGALCVTASHEFETIFDAVSGTNRGGSDILIDIAPRFQVRQIVALFALESMYERQRSRIDVVRSIVQLTVWREVDKFIVDGELTPWNEFLAEQGIGIDHETLQVAILASCPEVGLEVDEANSLLKDILDNVESVSDEALKIARNRRERRVFVGSVTLPQVRSWLASVDAISVNHNVVKLLAPPMEPPSREQMANLRSAFPENDLEGMSGWQGNGGQGIQRYVTDWRARDLLNAAAESAVAKHQIESLKVTARRFYMARGAAFFALRELWESVGGPAGMLEFGANYVRTAGAATLVRRYTKDGPGRALATPEGGHAIVGSRTRPDPEQEILSTVQHVILSVAADIEADSGDPDSDTQHERTLGDGWSVLVRHADWDVQTRWPSVACPAPIDDEELARHWEPVVERVPELTALLNAEHGASKVPQHWPLDYLVLDYLDVIRHVSWSRSTSSLTQRDLREPVIRVGESLGGEETWTSGMNVLVPSRSRAFALMLHVGVPLLCLPEAGLSLETSDALFTAWSQGHSWRGPGTMGEIAQLRARVWRERLRHCSSVSGADVLPLLQSVDAAHADWKAVVGLGRHTG